MLGNDFARNERQFFSSYACLNRAAAVTEVIVAVVVFVIDFVELVRSV